MTEITRQEDIADETADVFETLSRILELTAQTNVSRNELILEVFNILFIGCLITIEPTSAFRKL